MGVRRRGVGVNGRSFRHLAALKHSFSLFLASIRKFLCGSDLISDSVLSIVQTNMQGLFFRAYFRLSRCT